MRIVGGTWRGRFIKVPKKGIRPTKGIVRGAIFDIIGAGVKQAEVLDIFAGSGALGLEALSRGAKTCTFIETAPQCLFHNIESFDIKKEVKVLTKDFRPALKKLKKMQFDLIFADPPYRKQYATNTVSLIAQHRILRNGGMIVLEHSPGKDISFPEPFSVFKQKKYGGTMISFLEHRKH
jgi:16S rRNA (guanine(966)-N(2))-methyltransferase RsmD